MSYCKIIIKNIYKTAIVVLLFFVTLSVGIYMLHTNQATGSTLDNVSGYAWSSTIGWISFNCTDPGTCPFVDYGVSINDVSGNFSGYAWGENVGWIGFNSSDVAGCPSPPCRANLAGDNTVSGWAKALSADGLGWDGWIKLSDISAPSYGVTLNTATNEFEGYAWGGDVVGWISFNCIDSGTCGVSDYAVVYSSPNSLPNAGITSPATGSYTETANISFAGWGSDTDGSVVAAEWHDYGIGAVGDCSNAGNIISTAFSDPNSSFSTNTLSLGNHNICFRAQDNDLAWSTVGAEHIRTITITIVPTTACNNGFDDDGDLLVDILDPGCWTDPTNSATYDSSDDDESNPACINSIDDDSDGYTDVSDPGCWTDPTNSSTYDPSDDEENNCGIPVGANVCDIGETYLTCPEDCSFIWVMF